MNWIALFSHTGAEINNISNRLGVKPDKVITNRSPGDALINQQLLDDHNIYYTRNRPTVSEYFRLFTRGDFVTLHGWMRIIPEQVCNEVEIYNLHPGLISKYPELKGADPQKRVYNQSTTYRDVGCVIHRAVPEVDAGEIIMERSTSNCYSGAHELTSKLHDIAADMWVDFLDHRLKGQPGVYFK